ncbi:hypothetical protein [Segatella copri]|uniref:hypothetical protein n=1 Tax=Segatella copri TaxID=165179 RepID=UPI0019320965|nr:hypothetical protein [Segatella copri]
MEFNVSVQELLKAIGTSNIKSIDDNHSDKMFIKLSNAIIIGEPDWNYRVFSLVNSSLKFEIMAKQLYVASQRVL